MYLLRLRCSSADNDGERGYACFVLPYWARICAEAPIAFAGMNFFVSRYSVNFSAEGLHVMGGPNVVSAVCESHLDFTTRRFVRRGTTV